MKKSVSALLLALNLGLVFPLAAQVFTEDDKKEGKVKMKTFSDNEPGFTNSSVPDRWKTESAVILFQKYEYTFLSKYKNIEYEETYRRRIKLQDKAAVEDFSKFYWKAPYKQTGQATLFTDNTNKFYIQINIIKPNGTVVDVNTKDAVDVTGADYSSVSRFFRSSYESGSKKLAIPNLEPGDIIDYFYFKRIYSSSKYYNDFGEVTLSLGEVYPIEGQKYKLVLEDNFYIKMGTYNNAPKITSKSEKFVYGGLKSNDNVMVYSVEDKDREKFTDEPWSYELVSNPLLRFQVVHPIAGYQGSTLKGEKGVLKEKFSSNEIIDYYWDSFKYSISSSSSLSSEPLNILKTTMPGEKDVKKICDALYYAIRFYNITNFRNEDASSYYTKTIDLKKYYENFAKETDNLRSLNGYLNTAIEKKQFGIIDWDLSAYKPDISIYFGASGKSGGENKAIFAKCLEKLKIPYKLVLVPERQYGKIEDVIYPHQYTPVLMVEDGAKKYFYYGMGRHTTPELTDYDLEGAEGIAFSPATYKKDKKVERIKIPLSTSDFNKITTKATVAFDPTSFESTVFKREVAVHGDYKYDYAYLNFMNDSCDFQDMRYYIKDFNKKFKPKVVKNFKAKEEEMKKLIPEHFALRNKVVKTYHEKSLEDDYKMDKVDTLMIVNNGRHIEKGDIVFKDQIRVKEMAAKLGPNFSINIGKVIGDQATIEPKYMKDRKTEVNFVFARTIEYEILLEVPAGYKAEGIKELNSSLDNDACSFTSTAEMVGNNVLIKTKKVYKHNSEKKENWSKITDMVTAAYNFSQKKVILKKA